MLWIGKPIHIRGGIHEGCLSVGDFWKEIFLHFDENFHSPQINMVRGNSHSVKWEKIGLDC
jgi:hypothetical protein